MNDIISETSLCKSYWESLIHFGQYLPNLDKSELILTSFNKFELFWTRFIKFEKNEEEKEKSHCQLEPTGQIQKLKIDFVVMIGTFTACILNFLRYAKMNRFC